MIYFDTWNNPLRRVGIGKASPTTFLDVNGTISATGLNVNGTINGTGLSVNGTISATGLDVNGTINANGTIKVQLIVQQLAKYHLLLVMVLLLCLIQVI